MDGLGMLDGQLFHFEDLAESSVATAVGSLLGSSEVCPIDTIPINCPVSGSVSRAVAVCFNGIHWVLKWSFSHSN
jgi:hypothetical protein